MAILDGSFREFSCPPADVKVRHFKSITNEKGNGEKAGVNSCV